MVSGMISGMVFWAVSMSVIMVLATTAIAQPLPLDDPRPAPDAAHPQDTSSNAQVGHYETLRRTRANPPKSSDDYRKLERCALAGTCQ